MVILWEAVTVIFKVPDYFIPAPHMIIIDFFAHHQYLLKETGYTLGASFVGLVLAIGISFILAIIFSIFPLLEKSIFPFFIASQAIPIATFSVILIAIFHGSMASEVFIVIFLVFEPITVNWMKGLSSSDPDAICMMRSFGATRSDIFWKLRIFDSLPFLFSAAKVGAMISITGAIVGEFIGIPNGIGVALLRSIYYMNPVRMWTIIVICAILGGGFYSVVAFIERRVMWWKFTLRL
jgi:NitT/TauT family transport system permease protein